VRDVLRRKGSCRHKALDPRRAFRDTPDYHQHSLLKVSLIVVCEDRHAQSIFLRNGCRRVCHLYRGLHLIELGYDSCCAQLCPGNCVFVNGLGGLCSCSWRWHALRRWGLLHGRWNSLRALSCHHNSACISARAAAARHPNACSVAMEGNALWGSNVPLAPLSLGHWNKQQCALVCNSDMGDYIRNAGENGHKTDLHALNQTNLTATQSNTNKVKQLPAALRERLEIL